MPFAINFIGSHVDIAHINLRKQGNDDKSVLATDIKLTGETKSDVLNELLGVALEDDVAGLFWAQAPGADPESLRMLSLETIGVDGTWPRRIVHFGKMQTIADVKNVSFRPRPGHRLDVTLSVAIEAPDDTLLDYLVANLKNTVTCRIESQPELALEA